MEEDRCRICLGTGILTNMFECEELRLPAKIMTVARINVQPDDGLPEMLCSRCIEKLHNCIAFIALCQNSTLKLRALLLERGNVSDVPEIYENNIFDNDSNSLNADIINFPPKVHQSHKDHLETDILNKEDDKEWLSESNSQEKLKVKERKSQKEQCFTCGKVMSSRFRLKTHLRTHTGERPFSCPHCSKNFSQAQNLKVHLRIHTGEKPLSCTVCGAAFAQSAGLAAHKRKHTGQTPYTCTLCPRSFRTIGHLQYHIRRHTGEKNFECDTCGRAFITRSDLKQHLLSHTGDKPHVCCICGLRLTRASHLKRHVLQLHAHEKDKIYKKEVKRKEGHVDYK